MMADINITPLVDVMMVLLVIFMVTAPLLIPQSIGIQLPKTVSIQSPQQPHKGRLSISASGDLRVDEHPIGVEALPAYLAQKSQDDNYALSIEADDNVRYGRVAEVLAVAKAAGVSKISFVTVLNERR
jgi:biopolymer transport protein ExbD